MRKTLVSSIALLAALALVAPEVEAKGSFSSSSRSSPSVSRSSSPSTSTSRPPSTPYTAPTTSNKGSFSSNQSAPTYRPPTTTQAAPTAPRVAAPTPTAPRTTTTAPAPATRSVTTTTTTQTTRSGGGGFNSAYVGGGVPLGGWGMGYGYSNGLLTGLIIGNMLHPPHTTVYNGPGYSAPAVMHPNGAVVNPQGQQVGTYQNGQFIPMQNGPVVAQPAPSDAFAEPQFAPQPGQPVYVQPQSKSTSWTFGEVFSVIFLMTLIGVLTWFIFFRNRNKEV